MSNQWNALDDRLRTTKRAAFAETRRWLGMVRGPLRTTRRVTAARARRAWKIARERARNAGTAGISLTGKQGRRLRSSWRRLERRVRLAGEARARWATYRAEWRVEREIAAITSGSGPIIVGPWLSEVGYEVLYWVPFVRWVQAHHRVKGDRLVVVTRGGAAAWYHDIATRSVEIFDLVTPAVYAERNAERSAGSTGTLKQWELSAFDQELVAAVKQRCGIDEARVLHPSLMYRLFQQFMLGHRPQSFLLKRTIYSTLAVPEIALPPLPPDYVAMKLYTAASLPDTPGMRRLLQSLILAIAEQRPVVLLDTGLALDDHEDYTFERAARIHSVRDWLRPEDNLAMQTAIIGGASAFVGTCGSLAWLAPMLGVDTTALLADPRFLHGHLHIARRVYQTLGGGKFAPLDVGAFERLGLTIATAALPRA